MQNVKNEMYEYWINEANKWYDEAYGCVKGTERYQEAMDKYWEANKKAKAFVEDEYVKINFEYECLGERINLFYKLIHTPCGSEDVDALNDMYRRCLVKHAEAYDKKVAYEKQVLGS